MLLSRLAPEPDAAADFYHKCLENLGALCERSWHDRLDVVAEGTAARLWREDGGLHEVSLHFISGGDSSGMLDATRDVFPGCPLTFRLAEALRSTPPLLERVVLSGPPRPVAPIPAVGEKLWHSQFPGSTRWRLDVPFAAAHHFSLVASVRGEVQAIDQHWSLHRVALSLPDGILDEELAGSIASAEPSPGTVEWPRPDFSQWQTMLAAALETELAPTLAPIRARQQQYLLRELTRIEEYFDGYEAELSARENRSRSAATQGKLAERLGAARVERENRRRNQLARHEIRVGAHFDGLLLTAEPAWRAKVSYMQMHQQHTVSALFIPRTRRWMIEPA